MLTAVAALTTAILLLIVNTDADHPELFEMPLHVAGDIPEGRILHTLTSISDNRALLVGGLNESSDGTHAVADSIYLLTLHPGMNGTEPWGEW